MVRRCRRATCARQAVCDVIKCHLCLDKWVNVKCYDHINWILVAAAATALVLFFTCLRNIFNTIQWFLLTPMRMMWITIQRRRRYQYSKADSELGLPLTGGSSVYRATTVSRSRVPNRTNYRGPITMAVFLGLISGVMTCSQFSSMTASATECRKESSVENCTVQISTRLAVSPIGQTSCFKIANAQQETVGTINIKTSSLTVTCLKESLYYVPRATVSCDSHIQCYSLYSSSDCHGDKCEKFTVNSTIPAFNATMDKLGWSSCLALRIHQCPWWLTNDCNFFRVSLQNPTQEVYEVFNCPEWKYAAKVLLTVKLGMITQTKELVLQAGQPQQWQNFTFQIISEALPPTPKA